MVFVHKHKYSRRPFVLSFTAHSCSLPPAGVLSKMHGVLLELVRCDALFISFKFQRTPIFRFIQFLQRISQHSAVDS